MTTIYDDGPNTEDLPYTHVELVYTPTDASPEEKAAIQAAADERIAAALDRPARPAPKPRKRRRRRKSASPVAPSPETIRLTTHEARCSICAHDDRDAIEEEFIHWHSPRNIASDYRVERRAIYRHAHAFDLFTIRDRNLRYALGHVIEAAERVDKTAVSVIHAVRAFARVNNEGQWVEPPSHVIVSSGSRLAAPPQHPQFNVIQQSALPESSLENPSSNLRAPLDTPRRTEHDPND